MTYRAILLAILSLGFALAQDRAPIRIGGNVAQANRISVVNPVYPADAKRDRIQGTVSLLIMIDKTGHVANISVTGGPRELVQASIEAVQQWVYKPTLLNGEPVDVITTVDVNYTLQ